MPNVSKLGEGPEHGHVNCSLLLHVPQTLILSSIYDVNYDTPKKCPICTYLTSLACICRWVGV
jgi:hypothetical protein